MSKKVNLSEGSVFKLFMVIWLICILLGGFFVFPFGFIFMAIFGFFVALIFCLFYVHGMSLLFGERSSVDGGGSKFNFFRGRYDREGEDEDDVERRGMFSMFRRKRR